jgi:hypothetical protein
MNHRIVLGAAAAVAAVFVVPSFASAATTCNYDVARKSATIQLGAPFGQPTTLSNHEGTSR